jgi:PAS domain S-box-containing protein
MPASAARRLRLPWGAAASRDPRNITRAAFLAATMSAGALVLTASAIHLLAEPPDAEWFALLAAVAISGAAVVRMPGFPVSFSLSDTLTITAALLFGPEAGAVCVACDTLAGSMRLSRPHRTATTVLFNLTAPPLALWLAASLFFTMTGLQTLQDRGPADPIVLPLAIFATVYFLLNSGLVAGAITIGRDASFARVWREHFAPLWLTTFAGTSVAGLLLLFMTAGLFTVETLVVAFPLLIVVLLAFSRGVERLRHRSAEYHELRSYAAALRSTADGVLLTDGSGDVMFMNAMAERLTGWTHAEARGRPGPEIFRTRGRASAPAGASGEYLLVRRDGTTCEIEETHAYIRDEDGTIDGTIRTFRDISLRKKLEADRQALLRREQEARVAADTASRAKDEFLATLSHELRTPVMATAGWVRLLKDRRLTSEQAQKAVAAIDRTVRAQAAVLGDVLDMSRIVRGVLRLSVRSTSVADVLQEAIETVEPAVQAKALRLDVSVEPDLPAIEADADRLRQVFWNLLSNAVKFTPAGGSIRAAARRVDETIRVEVADTGCGIAAEVLPFIFERFRQADSSDTRAYEGLGLGLAIVRHLVEAHGGTVTAASDGPGRGARFVVNLPVLTRVAQPPLTRS